LAPYASVEGQVLVERIGRMTEAARGKRPGGAGALPPPSAPYTPRPAPVSSQRSLDFDDSVTHYKHSHMASAPQSYSPPSTHPPPSRRGSAPPPPPSLPPGYTGPAAPASIQPATMAAMMTTQPAMFAVGDGRPPATVPVDRRVALGALAAAAV